MHVVFTLGELLHSNAHDNADGNAHAPLNDQKMTHPLTRQSPLTPVLCTHIITLPVECSGVMTLEKLVQQRPVRHLHSSMIRSC
jgi:hypothetical protein